MDLTESAAAMKMALSIQLVPYTAEEKDKDIQLVILVSLSVNEMLEEDRDKEESIYREFPITMKEKVWTKEEVTPVKEEVVVHIVAHLLLEVMAVMALS